MAELTVLAVPLGSRPKVVVKWLVVLKNCIGEMPTRVLREFESVAKLSPSCVLFGPAWAAHSALVLVVAFYGL